MTEREELKPCRCGGLGQIRDFRIQFAVQCLVCGHTEYSASYAHLDHVGDDCDTDNEADAKSEAAFDAVDWDAVAKEAVAAWNRRAEGVSVIETRGLIGPAEIDLIVRGQKVTICHDDQGKYGRLEDFTEEEMAEFGLSQKDEE